MGRVGSDDEAVDSEPVDAEPVDAGLVHSESAGAPVLGADGTGGSGGVGPSAGRLLGPGTGGMGAVSSFGMIVAPVRRRPAVVEEAGAYGGCGPAGLTHCG